MKPCSERNLTWSKILLWLWHSKTNKESGPRDAGEIEIIEILVGVYSTVSEMEIPFREF